MSAADSGGHGGGVGPRQQRALWDRSVGALGLRPATVEAFQLAGEPWLNTRATYGTVLGAGLGHFECNFNCVLSAF